MKMKYEKPIVAVDRYELSQAIAGCSIKVGQTSSQCFLKDPDVPPQTKTFAAQGWFVDAKGCHVITVAGTTYDGVCYHPQVNGALIS